MGFMTLNTDYWGGPGGVPAPPQAYAYVGSNLSKTLTIVNVTDKTAPVLVGSVESSQLDGACTVIVIENYAYVAAFRSDRLIIVDVTDKTAPVLVG